MAKKILAFMIFFFVFSTIYGGMNYYVYQNIINGFSLTGMSLLVVRLIFWSLGSAYLVSQLLKRKFHIPLLSYLGSLWMGILSISVTVFVMKDVATWILMTQINLFLIAVLLIILLTLLAVVNVVNGPRIKNVNIEHKKFNNEPINIVHLSDIHLGVLTSKKWLEKVIIKVNNLQADLVVITGDMVDDNFSTVKKFAPTMKNIKAKHGVFAVAGNHEHYQGIEHFCEFCQAANIRVLNNESQPVAGKFNLIGLDDQMTRADKGFEKQLEKILSACNLDLYNILLVHQPIGFRQAAKMGIDLQLSGHTHRGQLPPLNIIVHFLFRYAYGLHSYGESHIYTSSGTGTWGPPMRLFSSSEIVKIQIN